MARNSKDRGMQIHLARDLSMDGSLPALDQHERIYVMQMTEYHKINSVYKRTTDGRFLLGQWSQPEFEYLKDLTWVGTEKIDGTNIRIGWQRGQPVTIRGRTDNAQIPGFLLDHLRSLFPDGKIDSVITASDELVLYGEGYGARIQKGGGNYIPDGVGFILFDVRCGAWWLERDVTEGIARMLGIPHVPVVFRGPLLRAVDVARGGFNSAWGSFVAEGLVLRPAVGLQTRSGQRVITKIKHKDFARVTEPADVQDSTTRGGV